MFIYDHIAGFVENVTGGEDDDNYDPHEHRKIKKPTTYGETMMHLVKGSLGAGLLAMPSAVARLGIVYGCIGIILIGLFATYCIQILVLSQYQVCKKNKRGYMAYHKSMKVALESGPKFLRPFSNLLSQGVDMFLILWQIGICAIYFVFVSENVKQILDHYGHGISVRMLICYMYPILLGLSLIKDLKVLAPFSTFSNFCVILGLILVFFYLVQDDVNIDEEKYNFTRIQEIPVFIGITLFALEAVGVVLALEYNMENPKDFTGFCGLFSIAMYMIIFIYTTLGLCGYLKYGAACKGSVTLNLPENEKKAQAAKLLFAMALFLSYPLQNFVAWQIIWRKLIKRVDQNRRKYADYILRVLVASIPFMLAVAAPMLGPFMGLMGALCLSTSAVMFPAVMELAVYYPNRYGFCYYRAAVTLSNKFRNPGRHWP